MTGTINGHKFQTVVNRTGCPATGSRSRRSSQKAAALKTGDNATVDIAPREAWPEPRVPSDLKAALEAAPPNVQALWPGCTPMATLGWAR